MSRFSYGVCEWSVKARGEDLCRLAAQSKLDCLQLGVGVEIFRGEGLADTRRVETYLSAKEKYGIAIHSLSPQFVDQYSFTRARSSQKEEIAVSLVERTIAFSKIFGCKSFLLPVLEKNGIRDGASFHKAVAYIQHFADEAAKANMETWLEINQSVEEVRNLLAAVDHPMVRIFFDSQNLYAQNGTSMARYFKDLSDVIGGVHLKDGKGSMLSGALLGMGTSGFRQTARAILESDYRGCLILESVYDKPTVCQLGTEEELLARDAETLHRTFGSI